MAADMHHDAHALNIRNKLTQSHITPTELMQLVPHHCSFLAASALTDGLRFRSSLAAPLAILETLQCGNPRSFRVQFCLTLPDVHCVDTSRTCTPTHQNALRPFKRTFAMR